MPEYLSPAKYAWINNKKTRQVSAGVDAAYGNITEVRN